MGLALETGVKPMLSKEHCVWVFIITLERVVLITSFKSPTPPTHIIVLFSGDKESEPGFRVFKSSLEIPREYLKSMDSIRDLKKNGFPKVHQIGT